MKRKLFFTAILLASLTINTGSGCEDCDATYLADLTLESFKSTLDYIDNGEEYYNIAHKIVNFVGDILGCESNSTDAGPNQFRQRIMYSDNSNFSNPVLVDEADFILNTLPPGVSGDINDQLAFIQNGYYLFHSFADFTEVVDERNEGNNEDNNPLDRSVKPKQIKNFIHVTMASNKPVFDPNGNRVYCRRISTTIKYE